MVVGIGLGFSAKLEIYVGDWLGDWFDAEGCENTLARASRSLRF
jgi:hypothetical protein